MTDKPTPKEIDLLVRTYLGDCGPQANHVYSFVTAVLAKWGQPAQAGEPFGYFHQLLNHEGKGNGVWLGAAERKVVEQAHTPGETSEEIVALYTTPQPTQAQAAESVPAVDEVAERYRNAIASACEGWTMPDGLRKHLETALWSQPTPQPTQAQATEPVAWLDPWTGTKVTTDYDAYGKHGIPLVRQQPVAREPLTDKQREAIWQECRYDNGGWEVDCWEVIDAVERMHSIKGGQHGTE